MAGASTVALTMLAILPDSIMSKTVQLAEAVQGDNVEDSPFNRSRYRPISLGEAKE
jgi:hypothetical protein